MRNNQGSCGKKVATLNATLIFSDVNIPSATSNDDDNAELKVLSSSSGWADVANVATSSIGSKWRRDGEEVEVECPIILWPVEMMLVVGAKADDGDAVHTKDVIESKQSHCILLKSKVRRYYED